MDEAARASGSPICLPVGLKRPGHGSPEDGRTGGAAIDIPWLEWVTVPIPEFVTAAARTNSSGVSSLNRLLWSDSRRVRCLVPEQGFEP